MKNILIEFAKQSGFHVEKTDVNTRVCLTGQNTDVSSKLETFAELIINECANIVARCDENEKLIVHEPYRQIIDKLINEFGDDE